MKLRNKKTGEIWDIGKVLTNDYPAYESLKQINENWEDVPEEPKAYWYIDDAGVMQVDQILSSKINMRKSIGNYFETKEEVEKAVEKLKAWKRLKDKGFKFEGIKEDYTRILQSQEPFRTGKRYLQFNKSEDEEWMEENWEDLNLLFGGE